MSKKAHILLIYTGGTIGMVKDYETGTLRPFDFDELIKNIPELDQLDCTLKGVSFKKPIDSSNMNPTYWKDIALLIEMNYEDYEGFVVLHGSDTMSYTASALSFMLENLDKPVIFTGSQLPIGDLRTDAKENLITAIQVAAFQEEGVPKVREVALYFEYKLYRANRSTKISSEQFEAFESPNYPFLAESGVHLSFNDKALMVPSGTAPLQVHKSFGFEIVVLKLFPGIREDIVDHILSYPNLQGVIMETYGAGNAPTATWFIKRLEETLRKKIPIVNVTQCTSGRVMMGHYETSTRLKEIGVIDGKDITTESALAKMRYLLDSCSDHSQFKSLFERPLRGEMS